MELKDILIDGECTISKREGRRIFYQREWLDGYLPVR